MSLFLKKYKPQHENNVMRSEGDVVAARNNYFKSKTNNLRFLIKHRFNWMNDFIKDEDEGIEVGCGAGFSREYIKAKSYLLTDFADHEWIDMPNVDALNVPFRDCSLNFVVSSNMIHHVPYPLNFFDEMYRVLRPGGRLVIQEINASLITRLVLRMMRHEGYDTTINVFDRKLVCTDPDDLWSANCAIPNLLFDDENTFNAHVPGFEIIHRNYGECFIFLNSGGVIAKTFFVPLPVWALSWLKVVDDFLAKFFKNIFAMQRQIVLRKR